jgi:phage terminase large subunit-like protein
MRDLTALLSRLPFQFQIPDTPEIIVNLPDEKENKVRQLFQALSKEEKAKYLKRLTKAEWRWMYAHPDIFLTDKQIILGDDWMYYLLRCGRGFGKTYCGAAWIAKKIRQGAKIIGLIGPSYSDVNDTMVPFIRSWFLPEEIKVYLKEDKIIFTNGAEIHCYSSEVEKKGPNLEYLWCDEIAVWSKGQPDKIKERYDDIVRSVRVGNHPQTIITSTPKNHPFFTIFQNYIDKNHHNYRLMVGSLLDNPTLSDEYILSQIEEHGQTIRGSQELFGDLLTDTPGAYWTRQQLQECRLPTPVAIDPFKVHYGGARAPLPTNAQLMGREPLLKTDTSQPYLVRIVIGFDPSGSSDGDECGIIVVGLFSNRQAWVLEDCSGSYNPDDYAKIIDEKYRQYQASAVVVESNFGGKKVFEYVLRSVNAHMKILPIPSKTGKTTRAEHASALYAQGKVHHQTTFKQLEDQMCSFNVHYSKSPDRLDALGFALTEIFWPMGANGERVSINNLPSFNR